MVHVQIEDGNLLELLLAQNSIYILRHEATRCIRAVYFRTGVLQTYIIRKYSCVCVINVNLLAVTITARNFCAESLITAVTLHFSIH